MPKKKRILIIGLPLFAKRIQQSLSQFDKGNQYLVLDTYYRFLDKIKFLFLIKKVDVVYSINGALGNSKVLDLAFKYGKKVVFHWVGSDVLLAKEQFKRGTVDKQYQNAIHLADAPWLADELAEIGIKARVQYLSVYATKDNNSPFPTDFEVLTYIPENNADFYGQKEIIELAKRLPLIPFKVVGTSTSFADAPNNVSFLGWVKNVNSKIDESVVTIRYVQHDGLSQFVLESMARGRYVLYNYKLKGVEYTPNENTLFEQLNDLKQQFDAGKLSQNKLGQKMIQEEFNKGVVLGQLMDTLTL